MRKLLVSTFLSLDGVMQAPGGPEEDDEGEFGFGGWTAPLWDEDLDRTMGETMGHPFDLLLGRRTYEIFAGFWPTATDEPGGKQLNDATKFVVSRSSPSLDWGPAELIDRDATRAVAELKEDTDGPELQVYGSGNLVQTLMRAGLIDEYRLFLQPVILGAGTPFFSPLDDHVRVRLVETRTFASGVVYLRYEALGAAG